MKTSMALIFAGAAWLVPCAQLRAGDDEPEYDRYLEILKIEPVKTGKTWDINVTFNLLPDIPKGITITFAIQLESDGIPIEDFPFTLADENRKNLKAKFTPTKKLFVNTYVLRTEVRLEEQTKDLQKAIETNKKRFPPNAGSWPFDHVYMAFQLGTDEDKKAEFAELKKFTETRIAKQIELNNEVLDEIIAAGEGKGFGKGGKLDAQALGKFLQDWGKRMGAEQRKVRESEGMYGKENLVIHAYLLDLGRMIAKRGWTEKGTELGELLAKNGLRLRDLKLAANSELDFYYRFKVNGKTLGDHVEKIKTLLEPKAIPVPGEDDPEAAGTDEKKPEDAVEKPKEEETPKAEKEDEKAPEEPKAPAGKEKPAKTGKKTPPKKTPAKK